jgi:hypothetical protein
MAMTTRVGLAVTTLQSTVLDAIEQEREKDVHKMVEEQEGDRVLKLQDAEDGIIDASENGAGPKQFCFCPTKHGVVVRLQYYDDATYGLARRLQRPIYNLRGRNLRKRSGKTKKSKKIDVSTESNACT